MSDNCADVRERIVEEFVAAVHDAYPPGLFSRQDAVAAAGMFLARYPHIAEGWPIDE